MFALTSMTKRRKKEDISPKKLKGVEMCDVSTTEMRRTEDRPRRMKIQCLDEEDKTRSKRMYTE